MEINKKANTFAFQLLQLQQDSQPKELHQG